MQVDRSFVARVQDAAKAGVTEHAPLHLLRERIEGTPTPPAGESGPTPPADESAPMPADEGAPMSADEGVPVETDDGAPIAGTDLVCYKEGEEGVQERCRKATQLVISPQTAADLAAAPLATLILI